MMLPKETVELLLKTGRDTENVFNVHENSHDRILLVREGTDGALVERVYRKELPGQSFQLSSVASFVQFLVDRGTASTDVWVGPYVVMADLDRATPQLWMANLLLPPSEEMKALQRLFAGVYQKDLWRLLSTDLFDSFPDSLLMSVSSIRTKKEIGRQVDFSVTGIESSKANQTISVEFQDGDQRRDVSIGVEWPWTGRLWSCWDRQDTIHTRLQLDYDDDKHALLFTFHARRLSEVYETARDALVEHLVAAFRDYESPPQIYNGTAPVLL